MNQKLVLFFLSLSVFCSCGDTKAQNQSGEAKKPPVIISGQASENFIDSSKRIENGKYQLVGIRCADPTGEKIYKRNESSVIRTLAFEFSGNLIIKNNKEMNFNMHVATFTDTIFKASPFFSCDYNRFDNEYLDGIAGNTKGSLSSNGGLRTTEDGINCTPNGGLLPSFVLNAYLKAWKSVQGNFIYSSYDLKGEGQTLALSFKNEEMMLKKGMCATKSGQDIDYDAFYLFKKLN